MRLWKRPDDIRQVVTGLTPFFRLKRDPAIAIAVVKGERPSKPDFNIRDELWSLMNQCWQAEPASRLTVEDLLQRLLVLGDIPPAEDWDSTSFAELQRSMVSDPVGNLPQAPTEPGESLQVNGDLANGEETGWYRVPANGNTSMLDAPEDWDFHTVPISQPDNALFDWALGVSRVRPQEVFFPTPNPPKAIASQ
ncbi:hypothetical protein VNI00_015244 [Paramarasmius palmivorus]|uniref:Serine-threonine/tyrosine-protein kinase catalytic domain-containing protein n=1 Tax=Paramarasmius palmivorus TaxID=297713 RepID=A0AAW0BN46_9AGAR